MGRLSGRIPNRSSRSHVVPMAKIVWIIMMVDTVAYLSLVVALNRRLRTQHAEAWDQQGRPTFWNNSPANGLKFIRFFIFSNGYRSLGDKDLDVLAMTARALFWGAFVFFAVFVGMIFTNNAS